MKYTGERVIPNLLKPMNAMVLEHYARYYFATPYCRGRVLDIACGAGYGTLMVAKECKRVIEQIVGVDNDPEIIKYAIQTYYHPQAEYRVGDVLDPELPDKLGTFDTILSFETLEHLEDDRTFVELLYRMLKPGGTLVLSTPFGEGRGIPSGQDFHYHQLSKEEFLQLFSDFTEVEVYYQRGVTIEPPRVGVHYPLGVAVCVK